MPDIAIRTAAAHEGFRNRPARGLDPAVEQLKGVLRRRVAEGQIADTVDPCELDDLPEKQGLGLSIRKSEPWQSDGQPTGSKADAKRSAVSGLDMDGILARRSRIPPRELAPSRTQSGALVPTYALTSLTLVS